jgi:outer membrane protein OmpA-like peptidoglycan-associated protein
MLTAINDFVGDSFQTNIDGLKEQLQTVSTDSFNLLIKPGPDAVIVAAVTGTPPQQVSEQLQITLEEIHKLYMEEFDKFKGDNAPFENSENQLRDCLLTEEKTSKLSSNKKPWFAWFLIIIVTIFLGINLNNWYQFEQLNKLIMEIDQQPGIVVQNIKVNSKKDITLDVMRDPDAISIQEWFNSHQLSFENISLKERRYRSLSPEILKRRAETILSRYSNLSRQWKGEELSLLGNININELQELTAKLTAAGIPINQLNFKSLTLNSSDELAESVNITQQIFKELVGKISTIQLGFDIGSNKITPLMQIDLQLLADQFIYLRKLAKQLNIDVGLLLMGSSDNSGNRSTNNKLSIARAENTATVLSRLGLNRSQMFVTGLGQIDIKDVKYTSRKVMFNIIYVDKAPKS